MSNTVKRFLSAGIMIPSALALVFSGNILLMKWVLFTLSLGLLCEYTKIVFPNEVNFPYRRFYLMFCGLCFSGISIFYPNIIGVYLIVIFFILTLSFLMLASRMASDLTLLFHNMCIAFFGVIYLGVLPSFIVRIYSLEEGISWLMLFFVIIWSGDIGAWSVGRTIGKHKFYPAVSPNKTWEGTIGGLVLSTVSACIYVHFSFTSASYEFNPFYVGILGCLVGAVGAIGDLVESLLKRAYDVKDSGNLIPGHGGLLDRLDSIIYASPVMFIGIQILLQKDLNELLRIF